MRDLLWITPLVMAVLCGALVLLIVLTKVGRTRAERRSAALVAPWRHDMLALSVGEDPDGLHQGALMAAEGNSRIAVDGALITLLSKVRGAPAEQLIDVLRHHGATDRALTDLGHRSAVRRATAAQMLGLCRHHVALPQLTEALRDPAPEVRSSATYAIGQIGNPAAAAALLDAVGAEHGVPAGPAADALEGMGIGVSGALRDALTHTSPTTRTVAAYISGEGSFTRSTPILRDLLARDPDITLRETAAAALGRLGRSEDVAVLMRHTAADQPTDLRRACAAALGDLGEHSAVPGLRDLLTDTDPRLAELAASSLLRLGAAGRSALDTVASSPPVETARAVAGLQGLTT